MRRSIAFALLATVGGAAFAGTNDYGGYDIVEHPGVTESDWGEALGWRIVQGQIDGRTVYCAAELEFDDQLVRIGTDKLPDRDTGQWQLAIPLAADDADWQGTLGPVGEERPASGALRNDWTIAWLRAGAAYELSRGPTARFATGGWDFTFPTRGIRAASLAVVECAGVDHFE